MRTVICRYCGEAFSPPVGKPGYIDECPDCLFEKRAALIPKPDASAALLPILEMVDTEADIEPMTNRMRRVLSKKLGFREAEIEAIVKGFIEVASKHVREKAVTQSEPED